MISYEGTDGKRRISVDGDEFAVKSNTTQCVSSAGQLCIKNADYFSELIDPNERFFETYEKSTPEDVVFKKFLNAIHKICERMPGERHELQRHMIAHMAGGVLQFLYLDKEQTARDRILRKAYRDCFEEQSNLIPPRRGGNTLTMCIVVAAAIIAIPNVRCKIGVLAPRAGKRVIKTITSLMRLCSRGVRMLKRTNDVHVKNKLEFWFGAGKKTIEISAVAHEFEDVVIFGKERSPGSTMGLMF